jgi:hypothetical protein
MFLVSCPQFLPSTERGSFMLLVSKSPQLVRLGVSPDLGTCKVRGQQRQARIDAPRSRDAKPLLLARLPPQGKKADGERCSITVDARVGVCVHHSVSMYKKEMQQVCRCKRSIVLIRCRCSLAFILVFSPLHRCSRSAQT